MYQTLWLESYNNYQANAEGIHSGIHINIGGEMSFISVLLFDSILWLYYCNIDQLWAIWQVTHPGVYLQPEPGSPTFILSSQGDDTIMTPLYLFHDMNSQKWNLDQLKRAEDIFKYGYIYSEVLQGKLTKSLHRFTCR